MNTRNSSKVRNVRKAMSKVTGMSHAFSKKKTPMATAVDAARPTYSPNNDVPQAIITHVDGIIPTPKEYQNIMRRQLKAANKNMKDDEIEATVQFNSREFFNRVNSRISDEQKERRKNSPVGSPFQLTSPVQAYPVSPESYAPLRPRASPARPERALHKLNLSEVVDQKSSRGRGSSRGRESSRGRGSILVGGRRRTRRNKKYNKKSKKHHKKAFIQKNT